MPEVSSKVFWDAMLACRTSFHHNKTISEDIVFPQGRGHGEIVDVNDQHNLFMVALWKREFQLAQCLFDMGCCVNLKNKAGRTVFQSLLRGSHYSGDFVQDFKYTTKSLNAFSPVAQADCLDPKQLPQYLKEFFDWTARLCSSRQKTLNKFASTDEVFEYCFGQLSTDTLDKFEYSYQITRGTNAPLFATQQWQQVKARAQAQHIHEQLGASTLVVTLKNMRKI